MVEFFLIIYFNAAMAIVPVTYNSLEACQTAGELASDQQVMTIYYCIPHA